MLAWAENAIFLSGFGLSCLAAPSIGQRIGMPIITIHLLLGLAMQVHRRAPRQ